jgi:threonine dehydrogenase-like Zn-dependent dehydrogenase
VPGRRGVLVRVLRVDGTDKEINAAEYGTAPKGDDFLIIGHESLGVVEAVGPNVPDTIVPGGDRARSSSRIDDRHDEPKGGCPVRRRLRCRRQDAWACPCVRLK